MKLLRVPTIVMAQRHTKHEMQFQKFINRVQQSNRLTDRFIVIHDECHWGINPNGAVDTFINDQVLLTHPNVLTLQVSNRICFRIYV